jgi:hypothetical protein
MVGGFQLNIFARVVFVLLHVIASVGLLNGFHLLREVTYTANEQVLYGVIY